VLERGDTRRGRGGGGEGGGGGWGGGVEGGDERDFINERMMKLERVVEKIGKEWDCVFRRKNKIMA